MNHKTLKPGFSVIELMFYTLIVGVLLAGAITGFSQVLKRGKKSATASSLRVIKQAVDVYYSDVQPNQYPETLDDLIRKPDGIRNWDGPYIEAKNDEVPRDGFGRDFHYERTQGQSHPYDLYSYGPNGEDAPEDEHISAW